MEDTFFWKISIQNGSFPTHNIWFSMYTMRKNVNETPFFKIHIVLAMQKEKKSNYQMQMI